MESNSIQANNAIAIDKAADAQRQQRLDQLILGGPGLIDPANSVNSPDDDGLRPEDRFERIDTDAALLAKPAPQIQGPEVGAPVVRAEEDVTLPIDGRGAAVTIQNHFTALREQNKPQQFAATAEALGVEDVEEFERLVERGNALQTFGAVDSNRLLFTDANFNEISADQVSSVAKAQLVIKPSYVVPVDPEVEAPEATIINPNLKLQDDLEVPEDPAQQLLDKLTQPAQPVRADTVVTA